MLLADVNVFIYAHRSESEQWAEHHAWLTGTLSGTEPFGVSELVLSSFCRTVTNHRVYAEPTPPDLALDFCNRVLTSPAALVLRPGERHWAIFDRLCRYLGARGDTIPDAYLAALAIEHGATWITTDRGFARFPGLRCRGPLELA